MTGEANDNTESDGRGDFFAVEGAMWAKVCQRGSMNEAVAYLVLARGSNFRTRTSAWSVDAIERRTAIARNRAKLAIEGLMTAGLIVRKRAGTKPLYHLPVAHQIDNPPAPPVELSDLERQILEKIEAADEPISVPSRGTAANGWPKGDTYTLAAGLLRKGKLVRVDLTKYAIAPPPPVIDPPKPDWIWLPNSLVDGLDDLTAPIEQVRQTGELAALRLLVDLYFSQSLAFNGGVHWRQIREEYEKIRVGQSGRYDVWAFRRGTRTLWRTAPFAAPHLTDKWETITREDGTTYQRDPGVEVFWTALGKLTQLKLVEFVEHLIDADTDEGEVIHPCAFGGGEQQERDVMMAALKAAIRLITPGQADWVKEQRLWLVVPMLRHMDRAQMVGVLRLKHRARTTATANWLSNAMDWSGWVSRYDEIGQKAEPDQGHAISKGHQG